MEQLKQFYEELLQEASKARFIKAIEGLTDEEKQEFIDFFDSHVNAQSMINWNNKSELTKDNLERVVNEVKAKADAKKKAHDKYRLGRNDPLLMFTSKPEMFDILKVDDKWIFAYCKSHAACNFADSFECGGAGAKWCVGWTDNPAHWKSYTGRGMEFVLAYNKKGDPKVEDDLKYMIQIDPNGQTQAWLQTDHASDTIKLDKFEEFFGLELERDHEGSSTDKPAVIEGNVYVKPPIKRLSDNRGISGTLKIGKRSFDVSFKAGYYRENANSISEIIVPEGIEVIAQGCFTQYFDRLEKIVLPSTLKEIKENAFTSVNYNSTSEAILEIPENVEKIADSAFDRCIAKKIIFRGDKFKFVDSNGGDNIINPFKDFLQRPSNRYSTYVDQLDCLNKTSKNFIIQKIGNGENSIIGYIISQLMPNGSEKLLTVNLPQEVETNAEVRAYLDKFTDVAKLAFCNSDFITLSSKITRISGPITDSNTLTLVIPESVEEISCDAFKAEGHYYTSFNNITILSKKFRFVPAEGHKNLEDPFSQVAVDNITLANGHDIYSIEKIGSIKYLISTENGKRTLLGAGIPQGGVRKIELPSNIYAIANNVMSGKTISVTSITIPDSVRLIGSGALKGVICNSTVYIGKNVVGIGNDALPSAKCVILPAGLKFLGKPKDAFKTLYSGLTVILTNTDAELANKFISQYPDINMIYNPEVIKINSDSIKGVIIAGNMVMNITKEAKGPIALPASVTSVNTDAASHATNITSLSFKSKSIEFQRASFYSCTKLAEITFPEKVIFNSHWCFANCKRLTSIKFAPVSIISFNGRGTFDGCKSLEKVVLPEGLLSLGDSTFSKCIKLTEVTLPSTLTNFGSQVFLGTELCKIKYNGTKAQWLALIKTLKSTRRSDQKILQSLVLCRDGFMLGRNAISVAAAKQYLAMLNQQLANKQ